MKGRSKRVLIISSSLRAESNSERLAEEALQGALEAGHSAELLSLKGKDLRFCIGCLACQKTLKCVIRDDMEEMLEKVKNAEVLIFVTPLYYYGLSGQLKTFLDRCNPLYSQECAFREIYLITTSAENAEDVADKVMTGLMGWVECFPQAQFSGCLSAAGVNDPGEIRKHEEYLKEARSMGRNV